MQLLDPPHSETRPQRAAAGEPKSFPEKRLLWFRPHFGDKSCRQAKGELLDEEGDTPSIFPGESVEEPTLLRLPSNRSGEWLRRTEAASDRQQR